MKRLVSVLVLAVFAGCNANVKIDPEGYGCDVGDACPTGYQCRDGLCRRATAVDNSCTGVTCDMPPAPTCVDGTTARTWGGRCVTGQCKYDPVDSTCPTTCTDGACTDPCLGVSCATPPQAACTDANTLRTFAQTGTCAAGACDYQGTNTTCPNGCENAVCKGANLCAGVTCNTPPTSICIGSERRSFAALGTCAPGTGACTYAPSQTTCANGCAVGQCLMASLGFAQVGPRVRFAVNALDIAPGSSGNSALAVGDNGKLARWDGSTWTELMTPAGTGSLRSVAFVTASLAYAVGAGRTALTVRPGANQVTPVTGLGGSGGANLVAVSGRSESAVLIADDLGEWWRLAPDMGGTPAWTNGQLPGSNGPWAIKGAYLDESLRERIVGACGPTNSRGRCVGYRFPTGGTPSWTVQQQTGTPGFTAVGGAFDVPTSSGVSEAFAGRSDATLVDHSTVGFTTTLFFTTLAPTSALVGGDVLGITAQATGAGRDVFALTSSAGTAEGHLYRLSRPAVITTPNDVLKTYYGEEHLSPNEANGVLVAEVRRSRNVNNLFRRGVVTNEALDVGEDFVGASVDDTGAFVFAGAYGDMVVRRPQASTFDFRRPPTVAWALKAVEARNGTGTLVVGQDVDLSQGVVVRMTGTTFTTVTSQAGTVFNGVCRVSDTEGWVVGTGGAILRVTGTAATAVTSPTTKDLWSVDCAAGVALACGADGTVLRALNGTWTVVSPAASMAGQVLKTCKLSGATAFVGGSGFFYRHDPGAGWTTLPGKPGLTALVVRGPQEIYGAFVSGDTSDVSRFDGAAWSTSLLTVSGALGGGVQAGARVVWGGTLGAIVEGR